MESNMEDRKFEKNSYYYQIWDKKNLNKLTKKLDNYVEIFGDSYQYLCNLYGYRGAGWEGDNQLVFAGCSFTFGSGIHNHEDVWGNRVAAELGVNAVNLSRPGVGAVWLVDRLFEYFNTYGDPEYLFLLIPNFRRIPLPIDGVILDSNSAREEAFLLDFMIPYKEQDPKGPGVYAGINYEEKPEKLNKYSRMPHNVFDVVSEDIAVELSVRAMRHLESYCRAAGIKLLWTSWDLSISDYIDSLPEILSFDCYFSLFDRPGGHYYKKYINGTAKWIHLESRLAYDVCMADHEDLDCSCDLGCHEEDRINTPEGFDNGMDIEEGLFPSHPGIHTQIHFAEAFLEEAEKRYGISRH